MMYPSTKQLREIKKLCERLTRQAKKAKDYAAQTDWEDLSELLWIYYIEQAAASASGRELVSLQGRREQVYDMLGFGPTYWHTRATIPPMLIGGVEYMVLGVCYTHVLLKEKAGKRVRFIRGGSIEKSILQPMLAAAKAGGDDFAIGEIEAAIGRLQPYQIFDHYDRKIRYNSQANLRDIAQNMRNAGLDTSYLNTLI